MKSQKNFHIFFPISIGSLIILLVLIGWITRILNIYLLIIPIVSISLLVWSVIKKNRVWIICKQSGIRNIYWVRDCIMDTTNLGTTKNHRNTMRDIWVILAYFFYFYIYHLENPLVVGINSIRSLSGTCWKFP